MTFRKMGWRRLCAANESLPVGRGEVVAAMLRMRMLIALLCLLITRCILASEQCTIDGIAWRYEVYGSGTNRYASVWNDGGTPPSLSFPSYIGDVPVWKIRCGSSDVTTLYSLTVPSTVREIGYGAFRGCTKLTNVTFATGIESGLITIGENAFYRCGVYELDFADAVSEIGKSAFRCCENLTNLIVSSSVTYIGESAFDGCRNLQRLVYEEESKLQVVAGYAFCGCAGIVDLRIPDSVRYIGKGAICGMNLHSLTLPYLEDENRGTMSWLFDGLVPSCLHEITLTCATSIAVGAFKNCYQLHEIHIPNTVTNIGNEAFSGCVGLETFDVPSRVQFVGDAAFSNCVKLSSLSFPDSLMHMRTSALRGTRITDLTLPFVNDDRYGSVEMPATITNLVLIHEKNISSYLFSKLTELEKVVLPDTVEFIGNGAFSKCKRLKSLTLPFIRSGNELGISTNNVLGRLFSPLNWNQGDGNSTYQIVWKSDYESGNLGPYQTTIDFDSAHGTISRSPYDIPLSLKEIIVTQDDTVPDGMFSHCKSLERIVLPREIKHIGAWAFIGCSNLTSISLHPSVTNIGEAAFADCPQVEYVSVPTNPLYIGCSAYKNCGGLQDVAIRGATYFIGSDAFAGTPYWDSLADGVITNGNWLLGIKGSRLSVEHLSMTGVVGISGGCFAGCVNLRDAKLGDELKYICDSSFEGCTLLPSVDIPSSVVFIGDSAFAQCSSLERVRFVKGVEIIGTRAFYNCWRMSELDIPSTLMQIGRFAFGGDSSVVRIYVPEHIRPIEEIFGGFNLTTRMQVREAVVRKGQGWSSSRLFQNCPNLNVVRFEGDCPYIDNASGFYAYTPTSLVTYVSRESTGWDGVEYSHGLPQKWPMVGSYRRAIEYWNIPLLQTDFDSCGGSLGVQTVMQVDEARYKLPLVPTKSGYAFVGWWTTRDGGEEITETSRYTLSSPKEYYAHWMPNKYLIHYNANGGVGIMDPTPMIYDVSKSLAANTFIQEGRGFLGWATNEMGEVVYADGQQVSNLTTLPGGAVTLYAVWDDLVVTQPVVTPNDGAIFSGDLCLVTITCATKRVAIYYSVNGATPRLTEAYRYTGPFAITDTTTIKAVAVLEGVKSEYVTATITKRTLTLSEASGAAGLTFTTGGDADWMPASDVTAANGLSAQSGAIGDDAETWMQTVISGAGMFAFQWKVNCEWDDSGDATWDHVVVTTNGVEAARMDGATAWEKMSFSFADAGPHTIRWTFRKDDYNEEEFVDRAWVSGVTWNQNVTEVIPTVAADATPEAVTNAVAATGFADAGVRDLIGGSATEYAAFKSWANGVKSATGTVLAGEAAVVENTNAAAAYLLGAERLFENAPKVEFGEMTVGATGDCALGITHPVITLSVVVTDGEEVVKCAAEKIAAMFEATSDLGDWNGDAKLTPMVIVEEGDGETMRFRVTPGVGTADRAFLRIRK